MLFMALKKRFSNDINKFFLNFEHNDDLIQTNGGGKTFDLMSVSLRSINFRWRGLMDECGGALSMGGCR